METLIGSVLVVLWVLAGFVGSTIRVEKGYDEGGCYPIVWGGPFWLLAALLLPPKR